MPVSSQARTRSSKNTLTSATTFPYTGCCCINLGSPNMCIRQTGTERSLAACSAPGRRNAMTSLISPAPAATDSRITWGLLVSTEIGIGISAAIFSITGTTRSSSCCSGTLCAPGRVDSPPTSMISAPSATISRARQTALSSEKWVPPLEKETGVTLRIPMTPGRESSSDFPAQSILITSLSADRRDRQSNSWNQRHLQLLCWM